MVYIAKYEKIDEDLVGVHIEEFKKTLPWVEYEKDDRSAPLDFYPGKRIVKKPLRKPMSNAEKKNKRRAVKESRRRNR